MENICKDRIIENLQVLIYLEPRIKVRYGFDESENLHLVEVSPDFIYDESLVERFENSMILECISLDSTSSLLFFKSNDLDFRIDDCVYEGQGEAYGFQYIDFNEKSWSALDLTYDNPTGLIVSPGSSFELAA